MMPSWLGKERAAAWSAIDGGADGIYGVTIQATGPSASKPRVLKCSSLPGSALNDETLSKLGKALAAPGCLWTVPLNRKEYSILVIPEPPVQQAEMEQSVRWAVGTMIDYPVDEANLAWMKIPTLEYLPNRPQHIYVMVTKSELVARYTTMFDQARLPLRAIDVRETAQRNIAALAEQQGEGLGLLLASKQGVQFTISFQGELYLDRFVEESLFESAVEDADAESRAFERIALQVQRSLDFMNRTMPFINVGRVLVAPMPAKTGLTDYLSQNLALPVEQLDLASLFDFSQTPELAREENQAFYFTALGAALRSMKKTI